MPLLAFPINQIRSYSPDDPTVLDSLWRFQFENFASTPVQPVALVGPHSSCWDLYRFGTILMLTALILHSSDKTCRKMGNSYCTFCRIHMLSTGPGSSIDLYYNQYILYIDDDDAFTDDLSFFWKFENGSGSGSTSYYSMRTYINA